jgi:hypothetical protein
VLRSDVPARSGASDMTRSVLRGVTR